jgi:RNA recognition motif-containing protein
MKIFVAKLSFAVNDEELKELFAEFGEVSSARVVTDKMTRRSKGFGFVEMPNDDEAKKAISELHECKFDGRVIVVTEAEDRPRNENQRGGGYSNSRNQSRRY